MTVLSCVLLLSYNNEVDAASLKISSFTASATTTYIKTSVKLSAKASGGSSSKKYKFYYKYNGKTYTIKKYSSSKSATFKPTKKGTYTVYVTVKSGSKTKTKSKKIYVYNTLKGSISLSNDYIQKNNTITISATSSGGKGSKSYKFYYVYKSETYSLQSYSSNKSITFTPESKGTYTIYVKIKDQNGKTKTYSDKLYVYSSTLSISASSNKSTPQLSQKVTLTATGSGGVGTLKYKFAKVSGSSTTIVQSYSTTNTYSFRIDDVSTTYTYYVYVKDSYGKVKKQKLSVTSSSDSGFTVEDMTLTVGQVYSPSYSVISSSMSVSISSVGSRRKVQWDKYNHLMPVYAGTTTVTLKMTYGSYSETKTATLTIVDDETVKVGADISKYQADVSVATLKDYYHLDYVILRIGYGTKLDSQFKNFVAQCDAAGMEYGIYIYTTATSTSAAEDEAEFVLTYLEKYGVLDDEYFTMPIYYDMEYSSLGSKSTSTINSIFKKFKTTLQDGGYDGEVGVYANTSWLKSKLTGSDVKAATLWQAHYSVTSPTIVYKEPRMWQVGSTFKVKNTSGTNVYIDLDYYYTDREQLSYSLFLYKKTITIQ